MVVQASERKIEERGLVLEGLVQHYHLVSEADKMKELMELLDNLDFNQVHTYGVMHELLLACGSFVSILVPCIFL